MDNSVGSFHDRHILPFLCPFNFFCRHFRFKVWFRWFNEDILSFLTQEFMFFMFLGSLFSLTIAGGGVDSRPISFFGGISIRTRYFQESISTVNLSFSNTLVKRFQGWSIWIRRE
jgi:hypothetical protein